MTAADRPAEGGDRAAVCTCPHGERSLGRLYGCSMGRGQVRLDTAPGCPVHAECAACGTDEWRCYKKRWAKGFARMLAPCCDECTHLYAARTTPGGTR